MKNHLHLKPAKRCFAILLFFCLTFPAIGGISLRDSIQALLSDPAVDGYMRFFNAHNAVFFNGRVGTGTPTPFLSQNRT